MNKRRRSKEEREKREQRRRWGGRGGAEEGESRGVGVGRMPQVQMGGLGPRTSSHLRASPSPAVCPRAPTGKDKKMPASQENKFAAHMCAPGLPQPLGRREEMWGWGLWLHLQGRRDW